MSVSIAEMAGHDKAQTLASSKKRKHTDEERTERKKNKKQKHVEVEDSAEVLAGADTTETIKKKKRRRQSPEEELPKTVAAQQEAQPDIELLDVEDDAEAPAIEATPALPEKKKKRKAAIKPQATTAEQEDAELLDADSTTSTAQPTPPSNSTENSPFHTALTSIYVPVPAIALTSALPSLISTHLMPLLLTYYPPLSGIILSISEPHLSSTAAHYPGSPLLPTTSPTYPQLALCADTSGVSFTWLTFTATTLSPSPSSTLTGYINVTSEGFIGLILYNYFQVSIAKTRIPRSWHYIPPGGSRATSSKKQSKKGRIRDVDSEESSKLEHESGGSTSPTIPDSQASLTAHSSAEATIQLSTGYWLTPSGTILTSNTPLTFRLVSLEIIPSRSSSSSNSQPDKLSLQIEGTLLDDEDEDKILAEERSRFERAQNKAYGRNESPGAKGIVNIMSGGLGEEVREGSVAAAAVRHRIKY